MTDLSEVKTLIGIPEYREEEYNVPHYLTSKTVLIMPLDVGSYPNVEVNPVGNQGAQGLPFATAQRLTSESWMGKSPSSPDSPCLREQALLDTDIGETTQYPLPEEHLSAEFSITPTPSPRRTTTISGFGPLLLLLFSSSPHLLLIQEIWDW